MPFLRLLRQRETKQKKYLNEPCKIGSVFLYYNVIVPQNQGLFGTFFLPRKIFFTSRRFCVIFFINSAPKMCGLEWPVRCGSRNRKSKVLTPKKLSVLAIDRERKNRYNGVLIKPHPLRMKQYFNGRKVVLLCRTALWKARSLMIDSPSTTYSSSRARVRSSPSRSR